MIDLNLLRKTPAHVIQEIAKKDPSYDVQLLITLDTHVRELRHAIEQLRNQKNELAKSAQSGVTQEIREQSILVGKELKGKEIELKTVEERFEQHYLRCPNIPFDDVPVGNKSENKVVKVVGDKPNFSFAPKNHVQLGADLGWLDFETAARIAGTNFALYKGQAVQLLHALGMLMLQNNAKHGYQAWQPSVLVNERSLVVSSNFPKFRDQVYKIDDEDLYLTPTAEVNFANIYRDEILSQEQLPIRMTGFTSCFRREAGAYGAQERGLIRIHQFEKVELYTLSTPDQAHDELERMLACAENILQKLGLHYRVVLLAGQDCSFPSAKTYDIEVWLPGQQEYYEVSSVSNCTDFQARRGKIRYRKNEGDKPELVYTLNGSSLALPRLMVALMETFQQEDGTIKLPEVLRNMFLW